ncbi:MAG: anti-anti-sigma factor [Paracrocinitomix sp.]|jgi:anti-anti-sigma factor
MAAELHITEDANNTVVLSGEIDTHTSPLLEEHLDGIDDATSAVLDLAAVSFISSAGLAAMLTAQSRLKAAGGSLTVRNPTSAVERMISLSGLTNLLGG